MVEWQRLVGGPYGGFLRSIEPKVAELAYADCCRLAVPWSPECRWSETPSQACTEGPRTRTEHNQQGLLLLQLRGSGLAAMSPLGSDTIGPASLVDTRALCNHRAAPYIVGRARCIPCLQIQESRTLMEYRKAGRVAPAMQHSACSPVTDNKVH